MQKKIISLLFVLISLCIQPVWAEYMADIEVFDIEKEQIVKRIANTTEIQEEMKKYLDSIDRTIPPLEELPKKGQMIRVPLHPGINVGNQWMKSMVYEVFFIVLPERDPFVILYDDARKAYLLQSPYTPKTLMSVITE
ncbi:hypothetical protein [Ammoniphilus sp. CFH 90114]|uniref:hypothetical protein n=1 Tax=Ammoniphilus sp. CFH 90114 TaxID=2493665 RepID=UPI00100F7780|nr:hypothetical protein [Ammoniphilus sp. CFH 90114]RXT06306.1 hypothetical protein EIZ39_14570 [Ammoniphilus sp. CFH 90114]